MSLMSLSSRPLPGELRIPSAPEVVANVIRDAIMVGRLKPGDRILEKQWATSLGVGQPTLREALTQLQFQGMVRRVAHRATYVNQLQKDDLVRLLEVRLPLEAIAFDRAARRITEEVKEELAELVAQMETAVQNQDMSAFHDADVGFHRGIWKLTDNEYLHMCLESVAIRLFVFSVIGDRPNLHHENLAAVRQHQGMLEGICTGDPAKARRAFVTNTLAYWNTHYDLNLREEPVETSVLAC
jgi:DNA-binding GntR family transcriptional regulator